METVVPDSVSIPFENKRRPPALLGFRRWGRNWGLSEKSRKEKTNIAILEKEVHS
jgi:hypothetical protein